METRTVLDKEHGVRWHGRGGRCKRRIVISDPRNHWGWAAQGRHWEGADALALLLLSRLVF